MAKSVKKAPKKPVKAVAAAEEKPAERIPQTMNECYTKHDMAVLLTQKEGLKKQISVADASEVIKCVGEMYNENRNRFTAILANTGPKVNIPDAPFGDTDLPQNGELAKIKPGGQ